MITVTVEQPSIKTTIQAENAAEVMQILGAIHGLGQVHVEAATPRKPTLGLNGAAPVHLSHNGADPVGEAHTAPVVQAPAVAEDVSVAKETPEGLPEKIVNAQSMRGIVLWITKELGIRGTDAIYEKCREIRNRVPFLAAVEPFERRVKKVAEAFDADAEPGETLS